MPRRNLLIILAVVVASVACYQVADHSPYLRIINQTYHEIAKNYVVPLDEEVIADAAVQGMMKRLDENSGFNSPERAHELQFDLQQKFVGIGVEINLDTTSKQLVVMGTLAGSPAVDAGILPGDKILKINDESTAGFRLEDAVSRIRGKLGERVTLTIERAGEEKPLAITVRRAEIRTQVVLGDTRNDRGEWNFTLPGHDKVGYVRINGFGEHTLEELTKALKKLHDQQAIGVILDLRGNPGGLLDVAIDMCRLFVNEGTIVSLRGRDGPLGRTQQVFRGEHNALYPDWPLVVMVNRYSASASEIVAACLQDHDRAIVVGERSYGKGTVQNVIPLEQDRSLRLTTAHFYRPSGKNIHKKDAKDDGDWGVTPNPGYAVEMTEDELIDFFKQRRQRDAHRVEVGKKDESALPEFDKALQKAVEYLEELPAKGKPAAGRAAA